MGYHQFFAAKKIDKLLGRKLSKTKIVGSG